MRKRFLPALAIALLALASLASYVYLERQVYHPVVQVVLPGGLSITAVLPDSRERRACDLATERFLAPFKQGCKECKVSAVRCDRNLEGPERAMRDGGPLPYPMVVARDIRIAVFGPPEAARTGCEFIAADIMKKGVPTATCVLAKTATVKP